MATLHHNRLQLWRIYLAVFSETVLKTASLRRLREHRSRLMGRLPGPGTPGIVLCACDEIYYARFATDLVLSAEATGQRHRSTSTSTLRRSRRWITSGICSGY